MMIGETRPPTGATGQAAHSVWRHRLVGKEQSSVCSSDRASAEEKAEAHHFDKKHPAGVNELIAGLQEGPNHHGG